MIPLTLTLPAGYHEVLFDSPKAQPTGLWSPPQGAVPDDSFFSIDTALSWLTQPEARSDLITNLKTVIGKGGLARERLTWGTINPSENRWNWESDRSYETTRRLYSKAGIPVLEMFHDTPGWMGKAQGGKFPDNLVAAGKSWSEIAKRWHQTWGAVDVWNEPDIGFGGNQPADQYVPLVKTVRHAMRNSGIETPIGGGVFAFMNPNYRNLAARNGLLDECDFFSFHYYGGNGDPLGLEHVVRQYRNWLREFGHETKPMWLTEVGHHREGVTGVRPEMTVQAKTAIMYAMTAVEARACGVVRLFPFVYTDYSEGGGWRHYGMVDHANTPLRIMAASAQVARALAGTSYIGDVPERLVRGARRIRVFAPAAPVSDEVLVVVYTSEVAPGAVLTLPFPAKSAEGIDGRSLEVKEPTKVPVPDGIVYVRATRAALREVLRSDTEAMKLYRLGHVTTDTRNLPPVSPIVLQPQIDPSKMQAITAAGYFLPEGTAQVEVKVGVNNMGAESRRVRIRSGNNPETVVNVPGGTRQMVTLNMEVASLPKGFGDAKQVRITAASDGGERIAPAEIALIVSGGSIAEHLKESTYHMALPINEAFRWDKNSSGTVTFNYKPPAAWGFTVQFQPNKDPWAYPRFSLPQEVDHSRVTGVLVRARCLEAASVKLMSWNDKGVISHTPTSIFPADGKWHVVYIPLSSYVADIKSKILRLSIGVNSQSPTRTNTIEISDLYVIGK